MCVPDYVETDFDCNGEPVDFDESSMVLKFRVVDDNIVVIPAVEWHYANSTDESVSSIISSSGLDINNHFDDFFTSQKGI